MREYAWWRDTATNMWRTYFRAENDRTLFNSPADAQKCRLCDKVYSSLSECDRGIVRAFHTAKMGALAEAVNDYSRQTGIPVNVIYAVIHKTGRAVMVELGIVNPQDFARG